MKRSYTPLVFALLASALLWLSPDLVLAQDTITASEAGGSGNSELFATLAEQLLRLLIVAIFVEIALTTIFQTRSWQLYAESQPGAKTIVTLFVSGLVVVSFDFNVFGDVMRALESATSPNAWQDPISYAITALLIAGGNNTIYQLYRTLNIRNPVLGGARLVALDGRGTLTVMATRITIAKEATIGVSLDGKFIGTITSDNTLTKANIPVGSYNLKLDYNNAGGQPAAIERMVSVSQKETEVVKVEI